MGTETKKLQTIETKILLLEEKICNLEVGLRNVSAKFEEFTGGVTDDLFIFSEKVQGCEVISEELSRKVETKEIEIQKLSDLLKSSNKLLKDLAIKVEALVRTFVQFR